MSTQHKLDEAFKRIRQLEIETELVIEEMEALNEKMAAREAEYLILAREWKAINAEVKERLDEADLQPLDEEMQPE